MHKSTRGAYVLELAMQRSAIDVYCDRQLRGDISSGPASLLFVHNYSPFGQPVADNYRSVVSRNLPKYKSAHGPTKSSHARMLAAGNMCQSPSGLHSQATQCLMNRILAPTYVGADWLACTLVHFFSWLARSPLLVRYDDTNLRRIGHTLVQRTNVSWTQRDWQNWSSVIPTHGGRGMDWVRAGRHSVGGARGVPLLSTSCTDLSALFSSKTRL